MKTTDQKAIDPNCFTEHRALARTHWSVITEAEFEAIGSDREKLEGKISDRYGVSEAQATAQVTKFLRKCAEADEPSTDATAEPDWTAFSTDWAKTNRAAVKSRWSKLTDDDLDAMAGDRARLAAKIAERYAISRQQAEADLDSFVRSQPKGAGTERTTRGAGTDRTDGTVTAPHGKPDGTVPPQRRDTTTH